MLSVLVSFYYLETRRYGKAIVILFIPALWIHLSPILYSETKITFLNVGQGDSIVIELPFRKAVYVIDAGGVLRFEQEQWKKTDRPYEVGKQVVVPFLKGKGIRAIDIFIATHADADHVEGAEEVLQEIKMKEIHVTPGSLEQPVMRDLLKEQEEIQSSHQGKDAGDSVAYQRGGFLLFMASRYLFMKEMMIHLFYTCSRGVYSAFYRRFGAIW